MGRKSKKYWNNFLFCTSYNIIIAQPLQLSITITSMPKILIIDDDPDILEVLQLTLQMEGFETRTNRRGEEIFNEVNSFKPDVILLDILLSGSDGRMLCKQLKSDSHTKNIPVILISAFPNGKDTIRLAGANDFIPKPFDIDDLLSRVEKQLAN